MMLFRDEFKKMNKCVNSGQATGKMDFKGIEDDVSQLRDLKQLENLIEKAQDSKAKRLEVPSDDVVSPVVHNLDEQLRARDENGLDVDAEDAVDPEDLRTGSSVEQIYLKDNLSKLFQTCFSFIKLGHVENHSAFSHKEMQGVKFRFASMQFFVQLLVKAFRFIMNPNNLGYRDNRTMINSSQSWPLLIFVDLITEGFDKLCLTPFE